MTISYVITLVAFILDKVEKKVFDNLLLIMLGLFIGMISKFPHGVIFMSICIFITMINVIPRLKKKIAWILNSEFIFKYRVDGLMAILPYEDNENSMKWLDGRLK